MIAAKPEHVGHNLEWNIQGCW